VRRLIPIPLSDEETASLVKSAASIRAMLADGANGQKA